MLRTNAGIIQAFLDGGQEAEVNNLRIEERTDCTALINYGTVIGELLVDGTLHFNRTSYSKTTSRIQNKLLKEAQGMKVVQHHYINKGSKRLPR